MNEKFEQLRAEIERQDAEMVAITKQLEELSEAGVAIDVPPEFFEALDAACAPPRRAAQPIHNHAVRA